VAARGSAPQPSTGPVTCAPRTLSLRARSPQRRARKSECEAGQADVPALIVSAPTGRTSPVRHHPPPRRVFHASPLCDRLETIWDADWSTAMVILVTREWRNGRRAGFRFQCPQGRGGSTPPSRTKVHRRKLGAEVMQIGGDRVYGHRQVRFRGCPQRTAARGRLSSVGIAVSRSRAETPRQTIKSAPLGGARAFQEPQHCQDPPMVAFSRGQVQLGEDAVDVLGHRALADHQAFGDARIGAAFGHQG
jgi:hypothetical protein